MFNHFKLLLGLLIVVAGMAYYVSQSDSGSALEQKFLVPEWQNDSAQIAAVSRVELNRGAETIKLEKEGERWVLNGGFFANLAPLAELMQSLQVSEIVELKTANPANHAQLELADTDLNVVIYQGEDPVSHWYLGKTTNAGDIFVRKAGENQTYEIKGFKPVVFNVSNWSLKTVLDYPADAVMRITFKPTETEAFTIQRNPEDMSLQLVDMPEGFQLKDVAQMNNLATGLTRLMIDEAMPLDLADKLLVQSNSYLLADGTALTVHLYQQEEDHYLTIEGESFDHYQNWMMKVASYKFNALNKQISDIVEAVPTEEVSSVE